jgi:hypothetical protein
MRVYLRYDLPRGFNAKYEIKVTLRKAADEGTLSFSGALTIFQALHQIIHSTAVPDRGEGLRESF